MVDVWLIAVYLLLAGCFHIALAVFVSYYAPKRAMKMLENTEWDKFALALVDKYIAPKITEELTKFIDSVKGWVMGVKSGASRQMKKAEKQACEEMINSSAPFIGNALKEMDLPFVSNPYVLRQMMPMLQQTEAGALKMILQLAEKYSPGPMFQQNGGYPVATPEAGLPPPQEIVIDKENITMAVAELNKYAQTQGLNIQINNIGDDGQGITKEIRQDGI